MAEPATKEDINALGTAWNEFKATVDRELDRLVGPSPTDERLRQYADKLKK